MASKDDFYQKIIAAQQAEIDALKTGLSELRKEIEALKAAQSAPQNPSTTQQVRINAEALLREVKRVCDAAILENYNYLPTVFADKQDFEDFSKSAQTTFVASDTFTTYQKTQEKRLKSIEDRLGQGFCLVAINHYDQKRDKEYSSIFSIFKYLKDIEIKGLIPFLVFLGLALFAVFMLSRIKW